MMNSIIDTPANKIYDNASHEALRDEYDKLYLDNKELLEGIYYAASVQQGLLPNERHFKRNFKEYFVFYRPLQIIGGDLYWVGQKNSSVYFATADCTGHGVSGAMLSVLAVSFLNYVLLGKDYNNLGEVVTEIDRKWLETFNYSTDYLFDNDWMELSLASFNYETRVLKFAGANSILTVVKENEIEHLKGNKFPVGGWQIEENRLFTEQSIVLPQNSMVYIGSDGYKDQFGGPRQKRFGQKQLNELLIEIAALPAISQKNILEEQLNKWKRGFTQTDDVCLMGIRL